MSIRYLTALPVYNEAPYLDNVLDAVAEYADDVLVVDDGSTDATAERLAARTDVLAIRHEKNRGYGAALRTAFAYAIEKKYDFIVTIDCDGQHEPRRISLFVSSVGNADIVSGSRYMHSFAGDRAAPEDRRRINRTITTELNRQLGLTLTDAFCGFKAYRVSSLARLQLSEEGYAMPLELWVRAAGGGLKIRELPVPRIYLDEKRSFGGLLDDPRCRLRHYREVIRRATESLNSAAGYSISSNSVTSPERSKRPTISSLERFCPNSERLRGLVSER